jgi:hypothetical protein
MLYVAPSLIFQSAAVSPACGVRAPRWLGYAKRPLIMRRKRYLPIWLRFSRSVSSIDSTADCGARLRFGNRPSPTYRSRSGTVLG